MNSKHEAEVEALRLAARGLPVTIVNPSFVLGPDAPPGSSMELVKRFLMRKVPAYVDGGLNIVDVRDVATGHLLADKKGEVGKRYILSGRNFTLDRLFADLGRISGVEPPRVKLPGAALLNALELGESRAPAGAGADIARRGALGDALVDVQEHSREAGAGLQAPAARGDARGAVNWQRSAAREARPEDEGESSSTAARRPRTSSARAEPRRAS